MVQSKEVSMRKWFLLTVAAALTVAPAAALANSAEAPAPPAEGGISLKLGQNDFQIGRAHV